jgi:ketosteroid isomerase-like protein
MANIVAPTVRQEDRRRGLQLTRVGATEYIETARQIAALGALRIDREVVAIRGERLALTRNVFFGLTDDGDRVEAETLLIRELDDRGRIGSTCAFDLDDLVPAFAELDRRYEEGEAAQHGPVLAVGRRAFGAWRERRWDELLAVFRDDAVVEDRRPLGWGRVDAAGFVDRVRTLAELAPDGTLQNLWFPRLNRRGSLALAGGHGTSRDGAEFEMWFLCLTVVEGDVVSLLEFLPADDLETACRRFDEVTAADASAVPPNACSRAVEEYTRLLELRDLDGISARVAADAEVVDHRALFRARSRGADAALANIRAIVDVGGVRQGHQRIATRGEHLMLSRMTISGRHADAPAEFVGLSIFEIDADGRFSYNGVFDLDQLDEAFAELDRRFRARASAAALAALRTGDELTAALEARDWVRFEAVLAPALEVIDHRGLGFQRRTRDDYVSSSRALLELAPDMRSRNLAQPRATPDGAVALWHFSGTYGDGTPFERPFVILSLMRDGVVHHVETFATDALDEAIARFDELTS